MPATRKKTARRKKLAPIPKFKGRTVLGLLREVKRTILEEPRRADMSTYCSSFRTEAYRDVASSNNSVPLPACRTVGCFAGWVNLLAGAPPRVAESSSMRLASAILGRDLRYDSIEIGDTTCLHVFNDGSYDITASRGTPEYARQVARRIDAFIKANKKAITGRRFNAEMVRGEIDNYRDRWGEEFIEEDA